MWNGRISDGAWRQIIVIVARYLDTISYGTLRPYLDDIRKWRDNSNSWTNDSSNFAPTFCPFTSAIAVGIGLVHPFFSTFLLIRV